MIVTKVLSNDEKKIKKVFEILEACSLNMYEQYGLMHWLPVYPLNKIADDSKKNELFLVYNKKNQEYVSTFQLKKEKDKSSSFMISKLATHPQFEGEGNGGKIIKYIEEYAFHSNVTKLEIEVYCKSEIAIKFYLKNGFNILEKKRTKRFEVYRMIKELE